MNIKTSRRGKGKDGTGRETGAKLRKKRERK